MAETEVTSPSGETITVIHPEGATDDEILAYARSNAVSAAQSEVVTEEPTQPLQPSQPTQPNQEQIDKLNQERMDEFSAIEKLKYEYSTTESFSENADIALEAWMPIGRIDLFNTEGQGRYASPTELYGNDFMDLSQDQRRERIQEVRYQNQVQNYPELTKLAEAGASTGVPGFVGAVAGALVDPTTFSPIGKSYKAMSAIGGLIGSSYEAVRGLAEEGKIDPLATAAYGVGGAVLTPALVAAGRTAAPIVGKKVSPALNKLKAKINAKRNPQKFATAEEAMDAINSKMMEVRAEGTVDDEALLLAASKRLGLTGDEVENAVINSNTKIDMPWNIEVNKVVLETKAALNSAGAVKNDMARKLITTTIRKVKQYSPVIAGRLQKFEQDSSIKSAEMMHDLKIKIGEELPSLQKTQESIQLLLRG